MTDFPWVKARAECSHAQMFERLQLGVTADVKARNELRNGEPIKFRVEYRGGTFAAHREQAATFSSVHFALGPEGEILITHDGATIGIATLTLNNEGQCRYVVNGEELEEWQLRKKALEKLFFGK